MFALTVILLGAHIQGAAGGCTPQLAALTTGTSSSLSKFPTWRKHEAASWRGEGWLGWRDVGNTVQSVRLRIEDIPKQNPEDDEEVMVESIPQVDYAVRCVAGVRPGTLLVGRRDRDNDPVLNDSLLSTRRLGISLGEQKYELRLESTQESLADARITLSDGAHTQVLYSAEGFADDPHFEVCWAGDLDRDGRLDLLVNFSNKYSEHRYRLLLSSRADSGQLIGDVATFVILD